MSHSRRDFLRTTACALGSFALASSIENFGVVHALTPQAASDYKALVMVFLNGGNDGNQMFLDLNQYNTYSTARNTAGLAIPQANYLPVSPVSGGSFGFHPNMTEIQGLFNQGKLCSALQCRTIGGTADQSQYQGSGKKPLAVVLALRSGWTLFNVDRKFSSQTGWGGRLADRTIGLNGSATFPSNVSIAGVNLYLTGVDTRQLAVADSNTSLANVLVLSNAPAPRPLKKTLDSPHSIKYEHLTMV